MGRADVFSYRLAALAVCYLLHLLPFSTGSYKCLLDKPEIKPKRHLYYNGQSLPIKIESSNRPSHQLVSHVLKILLDEVVGYAKTEIRGNYSDMNTSYILNRLGGCFPAGCFVAPGMRVPETMINLEVWSRAGFNMESWTQNHYVMDHGPLGPSGRYGWFMPTYAVENNWQDDQSIIDHWRALKKDKVASQFSLNERHDLIESFLSWKDPGKQVSYCQDARCRNGFLFQNHCVGNKKKCAVLLANDPVVDQGILKKQIKHMKLNVVVAWIGSHLQSFVHQQHQQELPTLFFDWEPNVLTAVGNYTRVSLPPCLDHKHMEEFCDFYIHQLSKVIWSKVETHAPEVSHVVSRMRFSQSEYEHLLQSLVSTLGTVEFSEPSYEQYQEAACDWLQQNRAKWNSWIPQNMSKKLRIYLGGLFPLTGPYWRQPGIVPGAQMAVELINANPHILQDYELVLLIQDTQCKIDIVMKQFMYYIVNETHPIAGILGPGCSETAEPIAGVSKHFNTIIVSYSAEALQLGNRAMFPFFFRTIPPISQNSAVYVDMFNRFGWTQVALLAEDGQEYPEYHTFLKDVFISQNIKVVYDRKMPRQSTSDIAAKYVEELQKSEAKIIIITSLEMSARSVICQAYKRGMTAYEGYVWFLPLWFTVNWWNTDQFNRRDSVPCLSWEMNRAIQGHFALSSAIYGPEESRIIGNVSVRQWKGVYEQRLQQLGLTSWDSPYASFAYDAVWVFGLGLHRLLSEDPSALESLRTYQTTQRLMSHLNNTHFQGVSGPVQFIGADRTGIINIYQHVGNATVEIGVYQHDVNTSLQLNTSNIVWFSGALPSDGRPLPKQCSIEGFRALLKVTCDQAIVVANVIGVSCFVAFMLICLVIVKKRYDDKVKATRDRMAELGLMADASWLCLDQWEVPRDRVVLNRKLGEGAFGTVYGGETLLDDLWVAVAVKTLKVGSTAEDKLEFLSEAEMMKRFDHENIVKLVGVCTRGEPAYAIMEFMLHGDMKTFLLARRQLIGLNTREAEDVSPLQLTQMARDVARGLEYLSNLKYVHRDLACRNCLVNVSKTVKIGDFGMTRPMYDSDYYRFNKRGMLPVRWMAPESLSDGLFSPMTDIWSYGVLVYEIITFGSFPYQGMSNKQVLEYVKNGNVVQPPTSCPTQLKHFLASCWSFDPESRPTVQQISSMFLVYPELIIPCLDTPASAVLMDGGRETLGIDIPPRPPKHTRRRANSHCEHNPVKALTSLVGDGEKRNSCAVQSDPFSLLGQRYERSVAPSVIRSPIQHGNDCRQSFLSDDEHDWDCAQHADDSEPTSPCSEIAIPLRHMNNPNTEERGDSDYCSDHSKDLAQAQLMNSSVV